MKKEMLPHPCINILIHTGLSEINEKKIENSLTMKNLNMEWVTNTYVNW